MTNLEKLKKRILEAKEQYQDSLITKNERHFLIRLAQDKYHRVVSGEFKDKAMEKYVNRIAKEEV